jgi:hypothetical protein
MTDNKTKPVWGVKAIAAVIGRGERATFHLLETNALPARKVGGRWASEEGMLLAAILPARKDREDARK